MNTMHGYAAMTRIELRLFRREPMSVVFVLAFPIMMMVLLAEVFGNKQADAREMQNGMLVWRGVTGASGYTVERRIGAGSWQILAEGVEDAVVQDVPKYEEEAGAEIVPLYVDPEFTPGASYRVTATNAAGASGASNEVSA